MRFWLLLFCAGVLAAASPVSSVDAVAILSGAVLADSFDGPELDTRVWHRPDWLKQHNPYIEVAPENGRLLIAGISRPAGQTHQYVGVISSNFRETDVVLAARMRVRSAFDRPGRIQHHIHLCTGDWPDFFAEVVFGKIRDGPPLWFSSYINQVFKYEGFASYLKPTVPASGREAIDWQEVVIEHNGETGETRGYLVRQGDWSAVGPAVKIPFHHSHVEVKVDVSASEANISMEVDDVRLYLHPARHPVIIAVNSPIVNGESVPAIDALDVQVVASPSGRVLGEQRTDSSGQARIFLKPDTTYPVDARIEVRDRGNLVLQSRIPSSGVKGLYPGDVWAVRLVGNK